MNDDFGLIGRTIDEKVRVDEFVAQGGFATVYRGFHLAFEQPVAIKCLKIPSHFDAEAQELFLAKFREEGKMLFRLSQHACIVRVFDLGDIQGNEGKAIPYLVLEWLDGIDLDALMKNRAAQGSEPWSETEALELLRPVVDAIALAHRLGIAHRDLKPSNLLLANTVQGELLKVLDFGIAKAMQEGETMAQATTRTSSGFHAFSPQYGAPEQFRSKRFGATGPWTDVHALGLIMTELVSGRPAMVGEEYGDFHELAMSEARPSPRTCGAQVSDAFETLCLRCLAREPTNRIQDADSLLAAMDALEMGVRDWKRSDSSLATTSPPSHKLADTLAAPNSLSPQPLSTTSTPVASPPTNPHRKWLLPTALAILGAMAALMLWFWTSNENPSANESSDMTPIPGGMFRMGSNDGDRNQRPEHDAQVESFELDLTQVTVEAFAQCVEEGICQATDTVHLTGVKAGELDKWNAFCNWGKTDRQPHPMNCVDWRQAQTYCAWKGKRLPTEQEWEYAARGGDENRLYPWGNDKPHNSQLNGCDLECSEMALSFGWKWKPWHEDKDGWPTTSPVGSFPTNAGRWGHQDLSGNVWEWTSSPFCTYDTEEPDACSKTMMAARGGGWSSRHIGIFRSSFRNKYPKEYRAQDVGFRCARSSQKP